ncbi:SDR family oxidoreductase [Longispora albida]|uniref:SDR family oxidoreductase n=1 Tax=Longispora albida TaxID=203523 RepID=UPI0012F8CA47|nr:NAD-dependent epimerase/dehydratase family protein [Longispora albida]
MDEQILVTGGTGTLGRIVVRKLLDADREVRVMSRRARPASADDRCGWVTADLRTGQGMTEAMAGIRLGRFFWISGLSRGRCLR